MNALECDRLERNPSNPVNFAEAINRGLNLVAVVALGLTGLTFGSDLFMEADPMDKIDNTLLLVIGVVAVVWYFMGRHWAQRSAVPVYLAAAALLAQIAGFVIEIGDPTALGDDIPGLILFVPLLIILAAIYSMNGRYLAAGPSDGPAVTGGPGST